MFQEGKKKRQKERMSRDTFFFMTTIEQTFLIRLCLQGFSLFGEGNDLCSRVDDLGYVIPPSWEKGGGVTNG